jgi:hypothetical protein
MLNYELIRFVNVTQEIRFHRLFYDIMNLFVRLFIDFNCFTIQNFYFIISKGINLCQAFL